MKKELGHEAIYDARQLGTPRMHAAAYWGAAK